VQEEVGLDELTRVLVGDEQRQDGVVVAAERVHDRRVDGLVGEAVYLIGASLQLVLLWVTHGAFEVCARAVRQQQLSNLDVAQPKATVKETT